MAFLAALRAKSKRVVPYGDQECAEAIGVTIEPPLQPQEGHGSCVWACGNNGYGRLGLSSPCDQTLPRAITAFHGFDVSLMAAGAGHNAMVAVRRTCGSATDEAPRARLYTWGKCHFGQMGRGQLDQDERLPAPVPLVGLAETGEITTVGAGESHVLVATERGVWGFGCGFSGALGLGDERARAIPCRIAHLDSVLQPNEHVVSLAGGQAHSIACTNHGRVLAWGRNDTGQLGLGYTSSQVPLPTIVSFWEDLSSAAIVKVASGHSHCLALSAAGEVFAWGTNRCAQCNSDPSTTPALLRPTRVDMPLDESTGLPVPMRDIGGGHEFSFAISRSNSLYTWGGNNFRQLGIAQCTDNHVAHATAVLHDVHKAAVGNDNLVAVLLNGRAVAWGRKRWGKCGTGEHPREWDDYKTASPDEMAQHWNDIYAHATPQPVQGDIAALTCIDVVCGGNHTVLRVRDEDDPS